jgi:hypothetical protein
VSHLGGGIDEFKINLFEVGSLSLGEDGSSEHQDLFLGSNDTSLNHQEVISNNSVMRESSHRGDDLVGQVVVGGGVVIASSSGSFTDSVDLFVHFSSVVVSELTGSGDGVHNTGRMPCSDTSDFSVTSMGFLLQVFNSESFDDSLESFTFGDSQDIQHFILLEDGINSDFLFEKVVGEVNFLSDGSSVNLDFNNVVLLLSEV